MSGAIEAAKTDKSQPSTSRIEEPEPEPFDPEPIPKPKTLPATTTSTHDSVTISLPTPPSSAPRHQQHHTPAEINALAEIFTSNVPEGTFSLAQLQGYMLTKKADPKGAAEDIGKWIEAQLEEKRKLEELKAKKRQKAKERAEAAKKKAAERAAKDAEQGENESKKEGSQTDSEEMGGDEDAGDVVVVNGDAATSKEATPSTAVNGIKSTVSASATETFVSASESGDAGESA